MSVKTKIVFDPKVRPPYAHLQPIVDLLLKHGNQSAYEFLWGENRTGFFCHLSKPIDFDLIDRTFELPESVRLFPEQGSIECFVTRAMIKGGMIK